MVDQQSTQAGSLGGSDGIRRSLARAQRAQVAHGRRVIVLFEGPDAAGKKDALRALAAALDPCHFCVHSIHRERRASGDGHWLARFWRMLPAAGQTGLFLRSWYRRVLDERLSGEVEGKLLARAFDEINEFEAQQRDYGTVLVKLYFAIDSATQRQRLAEQATDEWHVDHPVELDVGHLGYAQAIEDLKDNSDTRWSPWIFIDGGDRAAAGEAALAAVLTACQDAIPMEPPRVVNGGERAA